MSITPLYENVVIKQDDGDKVSAGGILLPADLAEKPNHGTVVGVGCGKLLDSGELEPLSVKIGDRVVFAALASYTINVDSEELEVVNAKDVFGIIPKQA